MGFCTAGTCIANSKESSLVAVSVQQNTIGGVTFKQESASCSLGLRKVRHQGIGGFRILSEECALYWALTWERAE